MLGSDQAIFKSNDGDMRYSKPPPGRLNARSEPMHVDSMGEPKNEFIDDAALTDAAHQ